MKGFCINEKDYSYAVLYIVIPVYCSGLSCRILAGKAGGLDYQEGSPTGDLDCKDFLCSVG